MFDEDRYARQRRLPEVGDAGQQRIFDAVLEVRGSDGALIEAEYLMRAGVERLSLTPRAEPEPFAHAGAFEHAAPARIAAGAWRALGQLRRVIFPGEP